jgi:DNA-binding transcriptional LysR family regulator
MTLKHLNIFKTVCEENSFSSAGEILNLSQPAVSLAIKELESFYGIKFFERMNRQIYITDAGRKLLYYADRILSDFNDSINYLRNNDIYGVLNIGANVAVGELFLGKIIKNFNKNNPDIEIRTLVENTKQIETALMNNQIDIAFADNISISPNFITKSVLKEKMVIVCSPEYWDNRSRDITLKQLSKEKLLLRESGSGMRASIDQMFYLENLYFIPACENVSSLSLIELAKLGLGITILSKALVQESLENGELLELNLSDAEFSRNYFIIYHKHKNLSPAIKTFLSEIKNQSGFFD